MALLDRLLQAMKREGGSDLLMLEGQPPKYRLHGRVEAIPGETDPQPRADHGPT